MDSWLLRFKFLKGRALGCRAGELEEFYQGLKRASKPLRLIVSTEVLSHGVNLPQIGFVVISYRPVNKEMWFQMVGRGGRFGSDYFLLTQGAYFFEGILEKLQKLSYGFILVTWLKFLRWLF